MPVRVASYRKGPVSVQPVSSNRKLTNVTYEDVPGSKFKRPKPHPPYCCSTYVSIKGTCPDSCEFKDNGCYIQTGITAPNMRKLDAAPGVDDPLYIMKQEAALIDKLYPKGVPQDGRRGGRDIRLHVGGDFTCTEGAIIVNAAVERYIARGGGVAWAYTARWREIPRSAYPLINVWASCKTVEEVEEARAQNYNAALTVRVFRSNRAYRLKEANEKLKLIPCPAQTTKGKTNCVKCRLCLDNFIPDIIIGFEWHGPSEPADVLPHDQLVLLM